MFLKRFYSIFLLTIYSLMSLLIPSSNISLENQYYYPLIFKLPPNIEVVVTKRYNDAFTGYNIISGYVINLSNEPYYSTLLEVDIVDLPYCDPSDPFYPDCDIYIGPMSLKPAFSTTLPGQFNPFRHTNLCYKTCTIYRNVRVENATHDPPEEIRYFPLTLVRWNYLTEDKYYISFSGVIRNDTEETLSNLRLVVTNFESCFTETEIDDTLLKPGQRTSFQSEIILNKNCLSDNLEFIGQGESIPYSD